MTTAQAENATFQVHQIFLKASPQLIWDAITQPEFSARYFYGSRVDSPREVGSLFPPPLT